MKDPECVEFLQQVLPRLHMRWAGFRKVRSQVCKRLDRRIRELCLANCEDYRHYLEAHPEEWRILDALSRVTISRFYREKAVFQFLEQQVFPTLIQQAQDRDTKRLRVLSLGSASGEEPYTIAMLWRLRFQARFPDFMLDVTATESDQQLITRAQQACYPYSAVRNLPETWRQAAFEERGEHYFLRPEYRFKVRFLQQDVRKEVPEGPFDLVLCRNLAFTYFDEPLQQQILDRISHVLREGGALVIGIHESLPLQQNVFTAWAERLRVYVKSPVKE